MISCDKILLHDFESNKFLWRQKFCTCKQASASMPIMLFCFPKSHGYLRLGHLVNAFSILISVFSPILVLLIVSFDLQVIVRDIISKSVITQFKAHKSPISALCFDPSGTLLVTASVQGHNINVFRIMPGLAGSSSGSDTCASHAHLYRLQRGFTNAVRAVYLFNHFLFTGHR